MSGHGRQARIAGRSPSIAVTSAGEAGWDRVRAPHSHSCCGPAALPTGQVVITDEPHPPVELVTIAATLERGWSSPAVLSACPGAISGPHPTRQQRTTPGNSGHLTSQLDSPSHAASQVVRLPRFSRTEEGTGSHPVAHHLSADQWKRWPACGLGWFAGPWTWWDRSAAHAAARRSIGHGLTSSSSSERVCAGLSAWRGLLCARFASLSSCCFSRSG
jgi:hypothetical protein